MNHITRIIFSTLLALSFSAHAAFANVKIGVVGTSSPEVRAVSEAGETRLLQTGDDIFLNDLITTSAQGSTQLMFLDKSAMTISPDSSVKVDSFVYDPNAKDGVMSLETAKGAFRFIGGALTKKKPVKIKTPVSTIGIRGGIVDTFVDANGATDAVFLFGIEMTMTNQDGHTTSTTNFGTGLGMANASTIPTNLPKARIMQRMMHSPVTSAVGTTKSNGGNTGGNNEINKKLNLNSKAKTQGSNNKSGGSGSPQSSNTPPSDGITPSDASSDSGANTSAFGTGTSSVSTSDNTAQETLRNDVQTFVTTGGSNDGTTTLFDISNVNDDRFNTLIGKTTTPTDTTTTPTDTTTTPTDTTTTPPTTDNTNDTPLVCLGCACTNSCTPPAPPRTALTESVTTPTIRGFFANNVRTNSDGTYSGYAGDGNLIGELRGTGTAERYFVEIDDGSDVWDVEVKKLTGNGAIGTANIGYWGDGGAITGWSGNYYVTADGSFNFYDLNRVDTGTETQYLKMILLDSDLIDNNGAGFASDTAAQAMLVNAMSETGYGSFSNSQGIVEYTFLPDMYTTLDNSGANVFGFYKYHQSGRGLLVDYAQKTFMGGRINFLGANPGLIMSVGTLNPYNSTIDANGIVDGGLFMDGYTFSSHAFENGTTAGLQPNEFKGKSGDFNVYADTLAFKDTAATTDTLSGLIVEGLLNDLVDNGSYHETYQGAVIGSGATSLNTSINDMSNGSSIMHKGYTAGLMMKGDGTVGRIKSLIDPANVQVTITKDALGEVTTSGFVNTVIIDNNGPLGSSLYSDFGGALAENAATQTNMYAAEVDPVDHTYGAMMSGKGLSDVSSVCTSCQFAHWGVWSTYDTNSTEGNLSDDKFTGLVPYVAGDVAVDILGDFGPGGQHTYSGQLMANMTDDSQVVNRLGSFDALINLGTRRINAYHGNITATDGVTNIRFGFNATDAVKIGLDSNQYGSAVNLNGGGTPDGGFLFDGTTSKFSAPIGQVNPTGGGPAVFGDLTGNINGALFGNTPGDEGKDIGGNFYFHDTTTNNKAGGIFIGTR